jgi:hypothetical protein
MCQQFVGPVGCFPLALVPLTDFVTSQDSGGVGSSINNKVYGHLEDRWATIKKLLVFFLLLSTDMNALNFSLNTRLGRFC